ncbi:putative fatty acyl-CoA reductase CG5065 isoform X1 [Rhodnius prolixus]|uniref:putative fatty acyl-CoA reductase CG5065 isoform X1 n=1 Tax=Rhodnius prolixus TaxID=13249 RepID=UPI003D18E3D2
MSEIVQFFKGKTIFLTGATGTIGKLLIDQLLRKCDPKKLYLLIRNKNNINPKKRAEKLFEEVLFERLRNEKPYMCETIKIVDGDLCENLLGIKEELFKELTENVEIVIHGAATVRFDEPLRIATNINVKGTMSVIKLCQQIKNLKAFSYISTAFSNYPYRDIKEELYDIHINCDQLMDLMTILNDNELNSLQSRILDKWCNTYVFTKAVAENAIKMYAKNLPVAIVRPSIVFGTDREPFPGWSGSYCAASRTVAAIALGFLRIAKMDPNCTAEMVPGDKVANCILAATYKTGHLGAKKILVYNMVTNRNNKVSNSEFTKIMCNASQTIPLERIMWPPNIIMQPNAVVFEILSLFRYLVPAFILTFAHLIRDDLPSIFWLYKNFRELNNTISYFTTKTWNFTYNNTVELWNDLGDEDRVLFNFDMISINWSNCITNFYKGIKKYLFKENMENINSALNRYERLKYYQNTIWIYFYVYLIYMIFGK